MSLSLLGYEFVLYPQKDRAKWLWSEADGVSVQIECPFCIHQALWEMADSHVLLNALRPYAEPLFPVGVAVYKKAMEQLENRRT